MFKKEEEISINEIYSAVKKFYAVEIPFERQRYLEDTVTEYGYLNIPYTQALKELSPAEIFHGLEVKWENEGVFKNGVFRYDKISPLARHKIKDTGWFKKEGHNIKLINLAGLGDGNETTDTGKFIDWLRQLLILPTGKPAGGRPGEGQHNNIFDTVPKTRFWVRVPAEKL